MRPALLVLALASLPVSGSLTGCGDAPSPTAPGEEPGGAVVSNDVVRVADPRARAAPAGGVSAVFFRVENTTRAADTLVAAQTGAAERVEVHRTTETADGLRGMEEVPNVPIPASGVVAFEPGGLHVMLVELRRDLVEGDTVYVDLDFARGQTVVIPARVRGLE